ncbi:MAG TPA: ice-binding family protein [Hanamia sp.]|nr:ice-binding family protein [Hanamia sp.]
MKNILLITLILLTVPKLNFGQSINLGSSGNFILFTNSGAVTNTGKSFVTGNVGTNTGAVTGFGNVNGVMHTSDGATGSAAADLLTAYNQINSTVATFNHAPLLGNGETFVPGVYSVAGNATLAGSLTLDGQNNPNSVFIVKLDAAFSTSSASQIVLINGALACNVFWKTEGMISMAANTTMRGTVIANNAAIDLQTGVIVDGRILSTTGAITLNGVSAKIPIGCGSTVLTGPAAPNLRTVACYSLFTGAGEATNSGISTAKGDIGTNTGVTTGYDPLRVEGTIHPIPDGSTAAAAADLLNVYDYLNTLPTDIELLYPAQFGNDLVLTPHTYIMKAATSLTDSVFLNAENNADAVFVIKIKGALSTSTYSKVILTNGTQAKNVYWVVDGAVSINDYSEFKGTIIANNGAVNLATGVNIEGRALTTTGGLSTDAVTVKITSNTCTVLPVLWLYFRGKTVDENVVLEWGTTNEVKNAFFTIEKSMDGRAFELLSNVKEPGTTVNGDIHYTFTDLQPYNSTYYRISQTDIDGRKSVYTTIYVKSGTKESLRVRQYVQGNDMFVQLPGTVPANGSIKVYSTDGKKISSQKITLSTYATTFKIKRSLNKGIYILVVESGGQKLYTGKVMVP